MDIFWFLKRKKPSPEVILNVGLNMAMEFGKNWLQPIDHRIISKFRNVSRKEAQELNALCKHIMSKSNEWVCKAAEKTPNGKLDSKAFETYLLAVDPRINSRTLSRLMGQAMYYASKDGYQFK